MRSAGSARRRLAAALGVGAALAGRVLAAGAPAGLYRGTAGEDAVTACWSADRSEFYVDRAGKTVLLEEIPGPRGRWMEIEPSGMTSVDDFDAANSSWWELTVQGFELRGKRHESGGARPLDLRRVAADCSAYEERRVDLPANAVETQTADGVSYRIAEHPLTGVRRVALVSGLDAAPLAAINAWLAARARELDATWVECRDWQASLEASFVSRRWLVFETSISGFCGGTHPNEEVHLRSFDARNGREIDFRAWLDPSAWSGAGAQGELRGLLRRKIAEGDGFDDCAKHRDAIGDWSFDVAMDGEGFEFVMDETDRAFVACERTIAVSFAEIRPFIAPGHRSELEEFVAASAAASPPG